MISLIPRQKEQQARLQQRCLLAIDSGGTAAELLRPAKAEDVGHE